MKYLDLFQAEQRQALIEVHNMCCFNKKDSKRFWERVYEAGEIETGVPVSQDSYELSMLKAREFLMIEAYRVFSRKRPVFNPAVKRIAV